MQTAIAKACVDSEITYSELNSVMSGAASILGKPQIKVVCFYDEDGNIRIYIMMKLN